MLLVEGIYLLLKERVTTDDVKSSSLLLKHYCFLFEKLYGMFLMMNEGSLQNRKIFLVYNAFLHLGQRYMTINIHNLLHLHEAVECLGPLWAHSCFCFEAANGELLNFFHGTQAVEKQVCTC